MNENADKVYKIKKQKLHKITIYFTCLKQVTKYNTQRKIVRKNIFNSYLEYDSLNDPRNDGRSE